MPFEIHGVHPSIAPQGIEPMAGAKPVEVEAADPAYWGSEAEGAKA